MHVGSCDRAGAEALWKSLPPVYRQCTVCYTDFWSAYEQVLPQNRHRAVGKENGKTNRIERSNLTLRKRISRLVRKCYPFLKKIENHIGAIKKKVHQRVHHYTLSTTQKSPLPKRYRLGSCSRLPNTRSCLCSRTCARFGAIRSSHCFTSVSRYLSSAPTSYVGCRLSARDVSSRTAGALSVLPNDEFSRQGTESDN